VALPPARAVTSRVHSAAALQAAVEAIVQVVAVAIAPAVEQAAAPDSVVRATVAHVPAAQAADPVSDTYLVERFAPFAWIK